MPTSGIQPWAWPAATIACQVWTLGRSFIRACQASSAVQCERRALAIYTAVAGAQLIARTRSDIQLFDALIQDYRDAGLIPTVSRR
ncbi:hypothetical protein FX982_03585 [Pseudomonas graminis]|uniref:Uncharacterized protein n=1 Tax=Pseudomonas graminis TaxID=158627 RepID=A0A6M8ML33_9PSED|nr:hypothetical protein FX982_03585 [Pseudomonas graminis]